ncbi:MAG TPA: type II secretion system minor pseudopilin GspJ [Allosphingosinicella sp.]|nr:type II secretion system minor pseudopilin GspJ [Allosphingosinicella sp.]
MRRNGFTLLRRSAEHGFTLVELLVSLFIFGLLSAAGVAMLAFGARAQENVGGRLDELGGFRRAGALLTGDLAQAAPRLVRDGAGAGGPAFVGASGEQGGLLLAFVRRGWENVDEAPRPSLQRVEYSLVRGRLERRAYPMLDGAAPLAGVAVAEEVRRVRLSYRDDEGHWRERWDPKNPADLPRAVELVMDTAPTGTTRQLFLTGTPL